MTVIIIPGMPPDQARIAAMGQLAQARTCLLIAERLLTAAGPKLIPAEVVPRVVAAREQTEQLALCVSALDPEKRQ